MGALGDAFLRGHVRLVEQLASATVALESGGDGAPVVIAFLHHLREQVISEERNVYSVLEALVPTLRDVTLALRREHDASRRIMADAEERMGRGDLEAAAADLRELAAALELHERREVGDLCLPAEARISPRVAEDLAASLALTM